MNKKQLSLGEKKMLAREIMKQKEKEKQKQQTMQETPAATSQPAQIIYLQTQR